MTTQQILQKAKKYVTNGWIQGASKRSCENGFCYCTTGAVDEALEYFGYRFNGPVRDRTMGVLSRVIRPVKNRLELTGGSSHPVAIQDWNDAGHRRKKDVLKAFDRAIAKAKKEKL